MACCCNCCDWFPCVHVAASQPLLGLWATVGLALLTWRAVSFSESITLRIFTTPSGDPSASGSSSEPAQNIVPCGVLALCCTDATPARFCAASPPFLRAFLCVGERPIVHGLSLRVCLFRCWFVSHLLACHDHLGCASSHMHTARVKLNCAPAAGSGLAVEHLGIRLFVDCFLAFLAVLSNLAFVSCPFSCENNHSNGCCHVRLKSDEVCLLWFGVTSRDGAAHTTPACVTVNANTQQRAGRDTCEER